MILKNRSNEIRSNEICIRRELPVKMLNKNNCFSFTGHDIIYCYNAEILISDNKIQTFSFISRPCWKLQKCTSSKDRHVRAGWYLEDYKCKWLLNYYPSKAQNFILCLWEFSIGFTKYGASHCPLLRPFFTQLHSFKGKQKRGNKLFTT